MNNFLCCDEQATARRWVGGKTQDFVECSIRVYHNTKKQLFYVRDKEIRSRILRWFCKSPIDGTYMECVDKGVKIFKDILVPWLDVSIMIDDITHGLYDIISDLDKQILDMDPPNDLQIDLDEKEPERKFESKEKEG